MKRILILLSCLSLIVSLCSCLESAPQQTTTGAADISEPTAMETVPPGGLLAGFGRANITPDEPVGMAGYGNSTTRISDGWASYIYAYALALTDVEGNTAVLVTTEAISTPSALVANVQQYCEKNYDIPEENILISAQHQHSTPTIAGEYMQLMTKAVQAAIDDAMMDRAAAELYINRVQTTALSFVRHYWTKAGTICGDNYGDSSSGYDRHESESDKEMQLVKFQRGDEEKQDIIVVNFQAHPHMGTSASSTTLHSDWPGVMRDTLAEELDCQVLYFSGAGGNLNSTSRIKSENISNDYKHHGQRAANYVIQAEDSYTKIEAGPLVCKQATWTYETDHSMEHLYTDASYINNIRNTQGLDAAKKAMKDYPEFHSIHHATAVVTKHKLGPTKDLTLTVISLGDICFTAHPYEMFDTSGMELKQGTVDNPNYAPEDQLDNPFAMTIITTCANGGNGYIPSMLGYTNGGYSTDITRFAPGTGELIVGDLLHLLHEIHP